jgi:ribosomal protein L37AE/L43A
MKDIYKKMYNEMKCMSCKKAATVKNEFNYPLCQKCLDYYMAIEIEALVEMTNQEQELYWRLYEDNHKRL